MISSFFIQSLAIIAVVLFLLSFHAKSRKYILLLQVCSIAIWTTHYFLLSAWTGTALMVLNCIATAVFIFKDKNKVLRSPFILYLVLLLFLMVAILSWTKWYSILPLLAISSITIAKWQDNPQLIRVFSFPASVLWIVYDIFVGAYGSIIAEALIIISIIISLATNKNKS
jgi:hypothetical protein